MPNDLRLDLYLRKEAGEYHLLMCLGADELCAASSPSVALIVREAGVIIRQTALDLTEEEE